MKVEYFLMLYTKVNSKWKIKLLEENIGRTFDDINQSKKVCDPPPVQAPLAGVQPQWIQGDSKVGTESASWKKPFFV